MNLFLKQSLRDSLKEVVLNLTNTTVHLLTVHSKFAYFQNKCVV